jgi:hypothetical protein
MRRLLHKRLAANIFIKVNRAGHIERTDVTQCAKQETHIGKYFQCIDIAAMHGRGGFPNLFQPVV